MAPVVEITEIERGKSYSAFNSWIPGGRIERMVWSWVERSPVLPWGGEVKTFRWTRTGSCSPFPRPSGHRAFGPQWS